MVEKTSPRTILSDRSVATVIGLAFLILFGAGLVLPVSSSLRAPFGVGYAQAGLLVASYSFARLVCDLAAGIVVDRWGERASGAMGLAVTTVGALLTGLTELSACHRFLGVSGRRIGGGLRRHVQLPPEGRPEGADGRTLSFFTAPSTAVSSRGAPRGRDCEPVRTRKPSLHHGGNHVPRDHSLLSICRG